MVEKRSLVASLVRKLLIVTVLSGGLVACSQPDAAVPANAERQAASAMPPAHKASLEVAFFNDFVVRNVQRGSTAPEGPIPRGDRIRAFAAQGLEIATLADQLFDFDNFGQPRDSLLLTHLTRGPWDRLRELALQGDPGAQCLFALAADDLKGRPLSVVTERDAKELAERFLDQSAEQKHPLCMAVWAQRRHPNDPVVKARAELDGAKAGCAACQMRLYLFYKEGYGLPIDLAKSYCWLQEAVRSSDEPDYRTALDMVISSQHLRRKAGEPDLPLDLYRPGSACTELANP